MAGSSLSKYSVLINHQVASQEHLSIFLSQAIAMLDVALGGDFSAFGGSTVHYYLMALHDIVARTKTLNEQLLINWATIIKLLDEPEKPPEGEPIH